VVVDLFQKSKVSAINSLDEKVQKVITAKPNMKYQQIS